MERMFRLLEADEIDCRVSTVSASGVSLLLYKDARADMIILDETVGPMNWQRKHTRDNANCLVAIRDKATGEWVEKEDTGTESNTEKEKGLASDSFKRACTNWGIGRELYTAPFIWVNAERIEWIDRNGKRIPKTRFTVAEIGYDEKSRINRLRIVTDKGQTAFEMGAAPRAPQTAPQTAPQGSKKISAATVKAIEGLIEDTHSDKGKLLVYFRVTKIEDMTAEQAKQAVEMLKKKL